MMMLGAYLSTTLASWSMLNSCEGEERKSAEGRREEGGGRSYLGGVPASVEKDRLGSSGVVGEEARSVEDLAVHDDLREKRRGKKGQFRLPLDNANGGKEWKEERTQQSSLVLCLATSSSEYTFNSAFFPPSSCLTAASFSLAGCSAVDLPSALTSSWAPPEPEDEGVEEVLSPAQEKETLTF